MRGFPKGFLCVSTFRCSVNKGVTRKGRGVSDEHDQTSTNSHKQEEEAEKEDSSRNLPRSETVLDYTDAVLAVG
jgi:hypothetical protein